MRDVGTTIGQCGRLLQEVSVAGTSIEAETGVPIVIMVVDVAGQGHRTEEIIVIGAGAPEAATWMTKRTCRCRAETQGMFPRYK